jgi:hypothetical protein
MTTAKRDGKSSSTKKTAGRPTPLPLLAENLPAQLTDLPQFVVWKYIEDLDVETGETDWDKPPFNARTGGLASSTNPATWSPFAVALDAYNRGGWDGLGFVLHKKKGEDGPGLVGVDLDKCRDPDTGVVEQWALHVVAKLNTYTEVSPSGRGIRLFVLGKLPPTGRKKGRFEVYETGRYFTLTGQRVEGTPATIENRQAELEQIHRSMFAEPKHQQDSHAGAATTPTNLDDAEILRKACEAKNGSKFERLWNGDITNYKSRSEADLALCSYLRFWCGQDPGRIDELFRQSGLFRSKWNRDDYRERTIARALPGDVYDPSKRKSASNGQAKSANSATPPEWPDPVPLNRAPSAAAFPITVLPPTLIAFVEETAWSLNCPPDFVATPLLAVAGGAIGNSRRLCITESHRQSACLFLAVVGEPGSGKSPALEQVTSPLDQADRRWIAEWREELLAWQREEPKGRGDRPIPRRAVLDDCTTEVMATVLGDNFRGVTMARDELSALIAGLNQYKAGRGHDRQVFLKLWSHATVRVDRRHTRTASRSSSLPPLWPLSGASNRRSSSDFEENSCTLTESPPMMASSTVFCSAVRLTCQPRRNNGARCLRRPPPIGQTPSRGYWPWRWSAASKRAIAGPISSTSERRPAGNGSGSQRDTHAS